jgi:hypothetical protein
MVILRGGKNGSGEPIAKLGPVSVWEIEPSAVTGGTVCCQPTDSGHTYLALRVFVL